MQRRELRHAEGVSNVELFYDLIFVYCINVATGLCRTVTNGFVDLSTWGIFVFSFLVIVQVWFYTTQLMLCFGEHSAADNACLLVNMFLLYFLASGVQPSWEATARTFHLAWALILVNLTAHWLLRRWRFTNLEETDVRSMGKTATALGIQAALVLVASTLPAQYCAVMSWVALLFGMRLWSRSRLRGLTPARFSYVCERCSLLTIVTFGEMVVGISAYVTKTSSVRYPALVFALVAGLFLIYIYEHDNMIDHHKRTDGIAYMSITSWMVVVLGNLTIALEYMPMPEVAFVPKSVFLMVCLVLYLLTSFMLVNYNKTAFHYSHTFVMGRVGVCVGIVAFALATDFDPQANLVFDTVAVYLALWHEWLLYHTRMDIVSVCRSVGVSEEDLRDAGLTFDTPEGRRALVEAVREVRAIMAQEASAREGEDDAGDVREKVE